MDYGKMTREEAISYAGIDAVKAVEAAECDFTNRVTEGTEWQDWDEFAASVDLHNEDNEHLIAYYYQKKEDVSATDDLSSLTWVVDHFSLW